MGQTLAKSEIVASIQKANRFAFTTGKAKETVEILLEIVKRTLASGEDVLLSGFGKFCVQSRNPAAGGDLMLAPRKVITFKCSGMLRGRINRMLKK